jgi:hypothetical protein
MILNKNFIIIYNTFNKMISKVNYTKKVHQKTDTSVYLI